MNERNHPRPRGDMLMKHELPCPFCGCTRRVGGEMDADLANGEYYSGNWIECEGCGIQGPEKAWKRLKKKQHKSHLTQ